MYLYEPTEDVRWRLSPTGYVVTAGLFVVMVVLGLWGAPLYQAADAAAQALFVTV